MLHIATELMTWRQEHEGTCLISGVGLFCCAFSIFPLLIKVFIKLPTQKRHYRKRCAVLIGGLSAGLHPFTHLPEPPVPSGVSSHPRPVQTSIKGAVVGQHEIINRPFVRLV